MESMDPIYTPRLVESGHLKIHDSRSYRADDDCRDGQQVFRTEFIQVPSYVGMGGTTRREFRKHLFGAIDNNNDTTYCNALTNMESLDFEKQYKLSVNANINNSNGFREIDYSFKPKSKSKRGRNVSLSSVGGDSCRQTTSTPSTPRHQLHIAHRKCGKRECKECKPKMENYHDLGIAVDPVLFTRWEVTGSSKDEWVKLKKVNYKLNGLGQVIKSVDKSSPGKVKESSEVIRRKVRVKLDTLKGQKVVARSDQDGLYYPAAVLKCSDPRHACVKYDSGVEAEVLTRNIIPTGGAVARPKLLVGDYVLMRVVNLDSNDECYVPAIIQIGPQKQEAQARFFTVMMYNGQRASTLRTYLLKISKERFELASMYIAEQQNENRKEVEDLVYVTPRDKPAKKQTREMNTIYETNEYDSGEKESEDEQKESSVHRSYQEERKQKKNVTSVKSYDGKKKLKKKTKKEKKRDDFFDESGSESDVKEEIAYQSDSDDKEKETDLFVRTASIEDKDGQSDRGSNSDKGMYSDDDGIKIRSERSEKRSEDEEDSSIEERSFRDGFSNRSDVSVNSKKKELEKLQRELQEREERQERQKRKLKKKARKLARLENSMKGSNLEGGELENALGIPVANNESGGIEDQSSMYKLLELRKSLHHLRPREEVLARWSDDGWYYRGMVKHYHGDYSYNLEDSTGFVERIWREDIISENDNVNQVIELDNKVVALHPDFCFSYAPATVTFINDGEMTVRFYDESEATLPWNEVYQSTVDKHHIDVSYIVKQEKRLIGASVVARDDKTGGYYPGSVTGRAEDGVDYVVTWTDGTRSAQKSIHIFSAFTRRPPLSNGDRVLALADPVHVKFLPGYIVGTVKDDLVIKFCDGETCEGVDPMLCYWLGQRFYDDAVVYYKTNDPSFY